MDWKQETILTLITIPIVSSVICGISEVIENKLKSLPYEYHNSFEYQRNLLADSQCTEEIRCCEISVPKIKKL